ncbi:predicted protein [Plenodomus lingam JN3]|uniref:Predicted protein n=1 Tax=Leptosphaeria maculans (strain JN3 / isolate v23.1.3 / race Av1-4-5-6-7-8) TaxID=985895 RepID=E5A4Z6_LEPMJ|nr:predicted protein [Plenodomus lingam JN3]CBX98694.1 predicted protein [Plenodomus lingam JN3]
MSISLFEKLPYSSSTSPRTLGSFNWKCDDRPLEQNRNNHFRYGLGVGVIGDGPFWAPSAARPAAAV